MLGGLRFGQPARSNVATTIALREETLGWRRRDGAYLPDPKASNGVVRRVVRWTDGRLVTLRFYEPLDMSLKAQSTRTDTFEVLSGPALKALPRIPEGYLVDDFAAAPDGPLVAIGARASETGGVRDAGYLFTWEPGQTAPVVAKLPGVEGEGRVPILLRSSSGELYAAGAAACARHGDGGPWCPVVLHAGKDLRFRSIDVPFDAPIVSASLADDGTLWVISGALVREDAVRGPRSVWSLSDGKTWRRITMPSSPIAAGTRKPHWVVDTLYPPAHPDVPSAPLEPVALVARRADDIWMVGEHRGGQAGFVRYLLHTEAPRSIADLDVPDDYQVFRDNVKPAPVADARSRSSASAKKCAPPSRARRLTVAGRSWTISSGREGRGHCVVLDRSDRRSRARRRRRGYDLSRYRQPN
jgi:hypothetical protein